jgi:molybdate transport system regulatory protein
MRTNKQNPGKPQIRSKIWIVNDDGEAIFGLGRLKILEMVERLGSLQAAARELKMSYAAVWGRIKATEKRLGKPLLVRSIGGNTRGGSELTPFARELIAEFHRLQREVQNFSDKAFGLSQAFQPPATPEPKSAKNTPTQKTSRSA